MLKFEWKMSKSIKILKFEYNKAASIKMLKFEQKRGDWSNVDTLLPSGNRSKFDWKIRNRSGYWNWEQTWESIKMLKFECLSPNCSKCCILSEKWGINQKVDIWVQ